MSAEQVSWLLQEAQRLPERAPAVLVPQSALAWDEAELAFGRSLATALTQMPELWTGLCRLLGAAWAQQRTAVLAISSSSQRARSVPWELLAESPEGALLAATRPFVLLRLVPGEPRDGLIAAGVRLVLWSPDAEDATIMEQITARRAMADALGIPVECLLDPGQLGTPSPPGCVDVLCVLVHGEVHEARLALSLSSGLASPHGAAQALQLSLKRAALVLLEVCSADAVLPDATQGLASRVIAAGASVVLAPRRPWLTRGFDVLLRALLRALVSGETLLNAVHRGLCQVAGLALAHPGLRPWSLSFVVSSVTAAQTRLRALPWQVEGSPLHPELAALLDAAVQVSRQAGHGFVGVEHLALGLLEVQDLPGQAAGLRPLFWAQREALVDRLTQLSVPGLHRAEILSPRLTRILRGLPEGAGPNELWRSLAQDPLSPLQGLWGLVSGGSDPVASTVDSQVGHGRLRGPPTLLAPPARLERLGGAVDGDELRLSPQQTLGRWHPAGPWPDFALYEDSPDIDERLSRRALTWLGPGRILLEQRGARLRRGGVTFALDPGEQELADGDILLLGKLTQLGFRADPPDS